MFVCLLGGSVAYSAAWASSFAGTETEHRNPIKPPREAGRALPGEWAEGGYSRVYAEGHLGWRGVRGHMAMCEVAIRCAMQVSGIDAENAL